ncbi:MAG TPA: hypothetical protein VGI86_06525, partial [Acidimicrobiia bacterium]
MVPEPLLPYLRKLRAAPRPTDGAGKEDALHQYFVHNYGSFHLGEDYEHLAINNLDKPSGGIRGCLVHLCATLPRPG